MIEGMTSFGGMCAPIVAQIYGDKIRQYPAVAGWRTARDPLVFVEGKDGVVGNTDSQASGWIRDARLDDFRVQATSQECWVMLGNACLWNREEEEDAEGSEADASSPDGCRQAKQVEHWGRWR